MELVVTLVAADRPGIVEQVAATVRARSGSWAESRMAALAGKFAGIIRVEVPDDEADALAADLGALPGLGVTVVVGQPGGGPMGERHRLSVTANDRPGIVAEVTAALAGLRVSVAQLDTEVEPAQMSGGVVFRALLDLVLPPDQSLLDIVMVLEGLSPDLMIDVAEAP